MHKKTIDVFTLLTLLFCTAVVVLPACSYFESYGQSHRALSPEATSKFMCSIKPYRSDVASHYLLACYFQKRKKHHLAVEEFRTAIEIDPTYVKAHNGMGISYDSLGDYARAIDSYKAALHVNPKLDYVLNNLGYAYLLQGKLDLAIDSFQQAIALNKGNSRYHNNLGLAYGRNGMYEQAFSEFKLAGDKAKAHHNMARLFYRDGLYNDAAVHFSKASTINHPNREADRGFTAADSLAGIFPVPETDVEEKREPDRNIIEPPDNNGPRDFYTVQCGAFRNSENAQERKAGLTEKGYDASVQKAGTHKRLYTVNVGVFETEVEAKEAAEEIMESEGFDVLALRVNNSDRVVLEDSRPVKAKTLKKDVNDKATPVVNRVVIEVSNGNGVNRMARNVGTYLNSKGFKFMYLSNADHFNHLETTIYYRSGHLQEAIKAAQKFPGHQKMEEVSSFKREDTEVKILIGKDLIPHMTLFQKDQNILIASVDEAAKRHNVDKKMVTIQPQIYTDERR